MPFRQFAGWMDTARKRPDKLHADKGSMPALAEAPWHDRPHRPCRRCRPGAIGQAPMDG
uniref:Uncharacterized protein n=1 Tax=Ralstonia solanacearum TaxID=305 RepID=A0A0S4TZI9_RALSL|nr:protein of unknown function [Ralstonia solanacearum]